MKWGIKAMPSKTSWFNKELILQITRNAGWISLVYFLGLSLALPLRILMLYTDERFMNNHPAPVRTLFEYDFAIQLGLMLVIPILMSVFLFRFLQVRQSADLMHSLPIKRRKIFHYYTISGMIGLVLPIAITALVVAVIHGVLDLDRFFQLKDILYWSISTIIINLLMFMAGVFVAMMTGISAVQGVLTYIFLLFPAGITMLTFYNLRSLLFGFPGDYYLNRNLEKMSPLTYASIMDGQTLQSKELILYVILTILLYGLSLYFYRKRKVESASEAIAFPKLRVVFKYGVTFCMMLAGGMYFKEVQANSFGWIIVGYVLGAVIGYYIAEMLLQKTWRVFGRIKGLVIYGVIIIVVMTGIKALGVYEDYVPDEDEIKNVVFAETAIIKQDLEANGYMGAPDPVSGKENIAAIRELQQQIISNKAKDLQLAENEYPDTAFFLYELKNGDKVIRQYEISKKAYEDYYATIYNSEEYKRASDEIFKVDPVDVKQLTITANGGINKYITFTKPAEIKEIVEAVRNDLLAESYQDREYFMDRGSMIEIQFGKENWIHFNFRPTFQGLTKWLNERDLLERVKVMPEDISYMQIVEWDSYNHKVDDNGEWRIFYMDPNEIVKDMEKVPDLLKVTEKEQIKEILENAATSRGIKQKFIVSLNYESGLYPEVLYIDESHTPDFIKNHFQK